MLNPQDLHSSYEELDFITATTEHLNKLAISVSTEDTGSINQLFFLSHRIEKQIVWDKVKHLFILGNNSTIINDTISHIGMKQGAYLNKSGDWLMLVYLKDERIQAWLNRFGSNLTSLIISHVSVESLNLFSLKQLTSLCMVNCPSIEYVYGIDDSVKLGTLTLSKCNSLRQLPNSERLSYLSALTLHSCPSLIQIDFSQCVNLSSVKFSRCENLRSLTGLSHLHSIKTISISHCSHLPDITLQECINLTACNISACDQLASLNLSGCVKLAKLWDLGDLHNLTTLNLHGCISLTIPYGLNRLEKLKELDISGLICRPKLDLSGCTHLTTISGLETLTELVELDLSKCTNIVSLSGLNRMTQLTSLNLARCHKIAKLPNMRMLTRLAKIDLSYTSISNIPDYICSNKSLRALNLSGLHLQECPWFTPDIATAFCTTEFDYEINVMFDNLFHSGNNRYMHIGLFETTIDGVDMSIFEQPYEMVLKWFEERKKGHTQPLNEIKVVFLGDGEAGKSHTIARLLNDGKKIYNFDGQSTPGIAITDRNYDIDGRQIQVHFWDFGGQEILHSMHRMFLTNRTIYVVLLNARDDKQDEQARYWLHNIKSFTKDPKNGNEHGAPVLLVINKLDQNPNASINESGLRKLYPGLTEVVRMSALNYSQTEFNEAFTSALKRQIAAFNILESPFTPAWLLLKDMLHNMTQHYIKSDEYAKFCQECGVEESETIRRALLEWFKDLGVSFCYSDSQKLEDYVVLQPQWITNAIYILLFNRIQGNTNGIISHEDLFRMLKQPNSLDDTIHRVLPNVSYSSDEVQYVLNVIRQFRLSYPVDDNREFFPMLCDRNETDISQIYAGHPDVLEFRMVYEYLPSNVLHRLMVDMHRDLMTDNVWLTGAHFIQAYSGLSAVVKSDGNTLIIYVRRSKDYPAKVYLDSIKEHLERISREMGLEVRERQVVYTADGISEVFNYQMILGTLAKGRTEVYSMLRADMILINDILRQTDHEVDNDRDKLIQDILRTCCKMQANKMYWSATENECNTYIRDALDNMGYIAKDQTLAGTSISGKLPGELDLEIQKPSKDTMTIVEGLKLLGNTDSRINYWDMHLKKLLDNYNPIGLPFLVLISYIPCAKDKFLSISKNFSERCTTYSPEGYCVREAISERASLYRIDETNFIRMMKCVYDCGGALTTVYHIFLRLGDE